MSDSFSFSSYEIHPNAILNNIKQAKKKLNKNTKIIAMIKADAYSVGAEVVAPIMNHSVDAFAVANLEEGIKLRNTGLTKEIFIMAPINIEFLSVYSYYKLTPTIASIKELNKLSNEIKVPLKVQIKVDSGLSRFGIAKISEFRRALEKIKNNNKLTLIGVFSHLATKEADTKFIFKQQKRFNKFVSVAEGIFGDCLLYHLANTNAVFNHNGLNFNAVRMGFGLYGMDDSLSRNLKPFISITSKIVSIKNIRKNTSIGYDRTMIASRNMKIGIVPLGYVDGINRRLSNIGTVLINGQIAKIVGRVSMDSFMIDLTDVEGIKEGQKVTILGKDGSERLTLKMLADYTGCSMYELLVGFSNKRMKIELIND